MIKHSAAFKHQVVRDLAWAISSPPLMAQPPCQAVWPDSQWCQQIYAAALPWLNRLDRDPSALDALLAGQKDRRLGKYFETLWLFWLSHHPRYQLIDNNLQVIIEGETLGEIDFIVFDRVTRQTLHWEVAVKFYLGVGDTREMCHWYGPNLRDRLDIKVEHLLYRQSVISRRQRVAQWLKQEGIIIDRCVVILKGRLYYPWEKEGHLSSVSQSPEAISPALCAPDHLYGVWLTQRILEEEFDDQASFIPLIKAGWMEKISTPNVKKSLSKKDIYKTVSNNKLRLPLQIQLENPCHSWDRAFITGDDWPREKI